MASLIFNRKHRVWVFIALLAYTAQSMASVGSSMLHAKPLNESKGMLTGESETAAEPSCHAQPNLVKENVSESSQALVAPTNCCDETCDMSYCHASSAILSTLSVPVFKLVKPLSVHTASLSPLSSIDTQYRPPISS